MSSKKKLKQFDKVRNEIKIGDKIYFYKKEVYYLEHQPGIMFSPYSGIVTNIIGKFDKSKTLISFKFKIVFTRPRVGPPTVMVKYTKAFKNKAERDKVCNARRTLQDRKGVEKDIAEATAKEKKTNA